MPSTSHVADRALASASHQGLDDQPEVAAAIQRLRERVEAQLPRHERRLPPERELVVELGVSRSVVRRALAVLESDGLVVRHVGRGTFIASGATPSPPQLQALATSGAFAIDAAHGLSPRELLEVRYALEPALAELAATSARPGDIVEMQKCLQHREAATQLDAYEHWDYALHRSIANATRNSVLIELLDLVNRMRKTGVWRQFRRASIKPNERRLSNAQHRAIVNAIACADPRAAFAAMRAHLGAVSGHYVQHTHASANEPNNHEDPSTDRTR